LFSDAPLYYIGLLMICVIISDTTAALCCYRCFLPDELLTNWIE